MAPRFSPDGRWVAHQSDESGRPEIYLRPFVNPAIKWQVSTDGGTDPVWNPQGGEIFYRDGDKMMVVDVALGQTPQLGQLGKPRLLFERHFYNSGSGGDYDVMPDGQHFIMLDEVQRSPDRRGSSSSRTGSKSSSGSSPRINNDTPHPRHQTRPLRSRRGYWCSWNGRGLPCPRYPML